MRRQKSEEKDVMSSLTIRDDKSLEIDVTMTTTGERRRLQVSSEWTSDQLLLHLLSSQTTAREYFVSQSGHAVPRGQSLGSLPEKSFEILPKALFTIELSRDSNEVLFGFSVESELISDDLCVYISRVERYVVSSLLSSLLSSTVVSFLQSIHSRRTRTAQRRRTGRH